MINLDENLNNTWERFLCLFADKENEAQKSPMLMTEFELSNFCL